MKKILYLVILGISFGYIEAAVVYYLRKLCYPSGFFFPLVLPSLNIIGVEIAREVATIFLLLSFSFLIDKGIKKWGYFCIVFGIWDIFYYVFLFILLKWPPSFFTYDILFLIPVAWVSPVLCPLMVSSILILYGFFILRTEKINISKKDKLMLVFSLFFIFLSFTFKSFQNPDVYISKKLTVYDFPWILFLTGLILFVIHFSLLYNKSKKGENYVGKIF